MTNFYVTYTLADKKTRDEFYADIKAEAVVSKSLAEDGCIRYTYFFPADNDYQIFLWEQWESREAQKAHTGQPHFKKLGEIKAKYEMETEITIEDAVAQR